MAMTQGRILHIHFVHGLESGPAGNKVSSLQEWAKTTCPDMHLSLLNPLKRNSVINSLLSRIVRLEAPSTWLSGALIDSFDASIALQREALQAEEPPDVLVGSSWGGAIVLQLVAEGTWSGPALVLCPATRKILGIRRADDLTARLVALSLASHGKIKLVHGTSDRTIPIEDSRELALAAGLQLIEVEGGSHGLREFTESGRLREAIESIQALYAQPHDGLLGKDK